MSADVRLSTRFAAGNLEDREMISGDVRVSCPTEQDDRAAVDSGAMGVLTGRLRRFIRRRVASKEDAEDVIQEAYLRVLRYVADHEVQDSERLLLTAAKNLAVDSSRRRRVRDKTATDYAVIASADQSSPAPDEAIYLQQRLRSVESALAELPPRCREVFMLHRIDSLTYSEIAAHCGISVSAVEKHIARACLLIDAVVEPRVRE